MQEARAPLAPGTSQAMNNQRTRPSDTASRYDCGLFQRLLPVLLAVFIGVPTAAAADQSRESEYVPKTVTKALKEAGRHLDHIEQHLSEWGHASISSFVLVPHRTNFFDLNYQRPMDEYVAAIRTNLQGKAAFLEQTESAVELKARAANALAGVNVAAPPVASTAAQTAATQRQEELDAIAHQIRMAQLQRDLARITNSADGWQTNLVALPSATNSAAGSAATASGSPTNREPALPSFTISPSPGPLNSTNGFTAAQKLLADASGLQLSETAILKLAATAKETERVLNFISHPVDLPGDKQAFFAIGQVSVMPGWRTKRDYICEVSARFTYASRKKAFLDELKVRNPAGYSNVVGVLSISRPNDSGEPAAEALSNEAEALTSTLSGLAASSGLKGESAEAKQTRSTLGELESRFRSLVGQHAPGAYLRLAQETTAALLSAPSQVREAPEARDARARSERIRELASEFVGEYRDFVYANDDLAAFAGWNDHSLSLVSAFPLVESQVFDLQNSYRSQTSFLLNLAATYAQAGYKLDGEILYKFVKRLEKDLATRTSLPTVIPGVDSSTLTYRFDPESSAMLEPTAKKPKAGTQLLPTSIPILVIAVAEKRDIARWEELAVEVETRWIPRANTPWAKVPIDWVAHGRQRDTYLSHAQGLDLATCLDVVRANLGMFASGPARQEGLAYQELRRRLTVLQQVGFGRTTRTLLPGREPVISHVTSTPPKAVASQAAAFTIHGYNLGTDARASLGGIPLKITATDPDTQRLVAQFGADGMVPVKPGAYDLEVTTTRGSARYPAAVQVIAAEDRDPNCEGRPALRICQVLPERGIANGRTVFFVRGEHFLAEKWNDPVTRVIVGGREAENVKALSDHLLRFEVGPWSDGLPYTSSCQRADVAVASACTADVLSDAVYFDVKVPVARKETPPTELEKQVELLKKLQEAGGEDARFSGSLRLEVGAEAAPAAGSSSTVINVQTGQNTNNSADQP